MTPSELADRLEEYEAKGLMESLSTAMFLNLPTILKSLRFAEEARDSDIGQVDLLCRTQGGRGIGGEIMSDLIERLEAEEKITRYHGGYARVKSDDLTEAVSALKTVRGIEGLAGNGLAQCVVITKLEDWWIEVKPAFQNEKIEVARESLSLAVDAAVGASERGEK